MSKLLGILSAISGLAGLLLAGAIFTIAFGAGIGGHSNAGSGLVMFQFWSAILSMAGVAIGIIAVMMAKGVRNGARKGGRMGIACGVLGMIALLILLQLL